MPESTLTRREARERAESEQEDARLATERSAERPGWARPAWVRRLSPRSLAIVVGVAAVALVIAVVSAAGALSRDETTPPTTSDAVAAARQLPLASALPVPNVQQDTVAGACDDPAILAALDGGTDADVIAAFGGGETFRAAVAGGGAPCVSLTEPGRVWIVVNKRNGIEVEGYLPELVYADGARNPLGGHLDVDTNAALAELAQASIAEGAGEIGIASSARADWSQRGLYERELAAYGREVADAGVARAGYSEHQTGLAVDVVACGGGCGSIDAFGGTAQGQWVAENAWRFGFIVRYEEGYTHITGYMPEPWHLRYIGPELAAAYHAGGFRTLEDFFGLPPAPDYGD